MLNYDEIKQAFMGQGALIQGLIESLSKKDWNLPSRLPGWDIMTLVAHIQRAPETLVLYSQKTTTESPKFDRLSYYNFKGPEIAEGVSKRAHEAAAKFTPAQLVVTFAEMMDRAGQTLAQVDPETVIISAFGPIKLADYLPTRVLELAVHGLDLQASLSLPLMADPYAEALTIEILEGLLATPRPAGFEDNILFIETATGRIKNPELVIPAFT